MSHAMMRMGANAKVNETVARLNDVSKQYSDAHQEHKIQAKIAQHLEGMFNGVNNAYKMLALAFNVVEGVHNHHLKAAATAVDNAEQIMADQGKTLDETLQTMIRFKCELETLEAALIQEVDAIPSVRIFKYNVAHFQVLYDPLSAADEESDDDGPSRKKAKKGDD